MADVECFNPSEKGLLTLSFNAFGNQVFLLREIAFIASVRQIFDTSNYK